jgi:hypothetical protein
MWDLVPWAARWAEGQSEKSQKYLADDGHKKYVSPFTARRFSRKAVFFLESVWYHAHAHKQQEQACSCSLACDSSLCQS